MRRDARSIVTELVTNALRQGRSPIELSLEQHGARVRIGVTDADEPGGRRPPRDWAQWIVDDLAACWGVRGDDAHVWLELLLTAPAALDDSAT
jgi:hypothetical protein